MVENWLSVEEISVHLGVSPDAVYKWVYRRKMPAHKLGRLWKFLASEVDLWVKTGQVKENILPEASDPHSEPRLVSELAKATPEDAMAVLPGITIPVEDFGEKGVRPTDSQEALIGQAYSYDWSQAIEFAKQRRQNVDQLVTAFLAWGLSVYRPIREILVWFAPVEDSFWLWACCKGQRANTDWMIDLPGYQEQRQDYIRDNAIPVASWDRANVYRVYPRVFLAQGPGPWVCDFGNLAGATITSDSRDAYDRIKKNPVTHSKYSVVPEQPDEILTWNGVRVLVTHATMDVVASTQDSSSSIATTCR